MNSPQIKKIVVLKCRLLFSVQQQQIISWLDCNMWWKVGFIWQLVMTSSVVGQRSSYKALPKAKLAPKKKKGHEGHGHCLVVCCWSDPPQLSESWQNQYMWEIRSANRWDALKTVTPAVDTGQRKGPILLHNNAWPRHTTKASKVEWIGLWSFAFSTWPLANRLPLVQAFQQLFAGKMLPQSAGGRKCFPRVCQIPRHGFFCYRNKQTYFLLAKMHWL